MAKKKTLKSKTDKRRRAAVQIGIKPDGTPLVKWVSGRNAAELEAAKAEIKQRYTNTYGTDSDALTVQTYVKDYWLPPYLAKLAPGSRNNILSALNRRILPAVGVLRISAVRTNQLQNIVVKAADEGLSSKVIQRTASIIRKIFRSANAAGFIKFDPAYEVTAAISQQQPHHRRALTADESAAVAQLAKDDILLALLYYTGMRRGELLGLEWGDIDLKAGTITISRSCDLIHHVIKEPKTVAGTRVIPIAAELAAVLRPAKGIGLICETAIQGGLSHWRYERWWRQVTRSITALAPESERRPDGRSILTPHYLRHNFASVLHSAGIPAERARVWLGHSSVAVTLDIYTHLDEIEQAKSTATFARAWQ